MSASARLPLPDTSWPTTAGSNLRWSGLERDVREAVAEDPLVSFEECLPHAFGTTTGLAFLVLDVVAVEQQRLVLVELLTSITQSNEI